MKSAKECRVSQKFNIDTNRSLGRGYSPATTWPIGAGGAGRAPRRRDYLTLQLGEIGRRNHRETRTIASIEIAMLASIAVGQAGCVGCSRIQAKARSRAACEG